MIRAMKMTLNRNASEGGFQLKGLILVLICGFYGFLLFLIAAMLTRLATYVSYTVKSIFWKVEVTEAETIVEVLDHNNNECKKRRSTRSLCFG